MILLLQPINHSFLFIFVTRLILGFFAPVIHLLPSQPLLVLGVGPVIPPALFFACFAAHSCLSLLCSLIISFRNFPLSSWAALHETCNMESLDFWCHSSQLTLAKIVNCNSSYLPTEDVLFLNEKISRLLPTNNGIVNCNVCNFVRVSVSIVLHIHQIPCNLIKVSLVNCHNIGYLT